MENIYLIQNHPNSFKLSIKELYNPEKFCFYLICNQVAYDKLIERNETHFFKEIFTTLDFSFDSLRLIIDTFQKRSNNTFNIVSNAENAILICGILKKHYGLQKKDNKRFINKIEMKEILSNGNIRIPKFLVFSRSDFSENKIEYLNYIIQAISFPILAKPISAAGSFGISKLHNYDELFIWANEVAFDELDYELDEYIEGTLYHCDSFIQNQQVLYTQIGKDSSPCGEFMFGKNHGSIIIPFDSEMSLILSAYSKKVLEILEPPINGVTHMEVFVTNKMELIFLEIAYRSPGGLIPLMYEKYLGFGIAEANIKLQIDKSYLLPKFSFRTYAAWMTFPTKNGTIKSIDSPKLKSLNTINWLYNVGDITNSPFNFRGAIGEVFFWNDNYNMLTGDFEYLMTLEPCSYN
jgi:biotin carboxylase